MSTEQTQIVLDVFEEVELLSELLLAHVIPPEVGLYTKNSLTPIIKPDGEYEVSKDSGKTFIQVSGRQMRLLIEEVLDNPDIRALTKQEFIRTLVIWDSQSSNLIRGSKLTDLAPEPNPVLLFTNIVARVLETYCTRMGKWRLIQETLAGKCTITCQCRRGTISTLGSICPDCGYSVNIHTYQKTKIAKNKSAVSEIEDIAWEHFAFSITEEESQKARLARSSFEIKYYDLRRRRTMRPEEKQELCRLYDEMVLVGQPQNVAVRKTVEILETVCSQLWVALEESLRNIPNWKYRPCYVVTKANALGSIVLRLEEDIRITMFEALVLPPDTSKEKTPSPVIAIRP